MKFLFGTVALAGMASAAAVTSCNANNCLRAVRASAFTTRSGTADCAAYQTTYTTPLATVTVAGAVASSPPAVTPAAKPTKPAYASSCADDAAYRSACSCVGQTSTLIVAATSTVTVTTAAGPAACTTFALKAVGGNYPGTYVVQYSDSPNFHLSGPDPVTAAHFEYRNGGRFYSPGTSFLLGAIYDSSFAGLKLDTAESLVADGYGLLTCTIAAGSGALSCPGTYFYTLTSDLIFTSGTADYQGLTEFSLVAVPVC